MDECTLQYALHFKVLSLIQFQIALWPFAIHFECLSLCVRVCARVYACAAREVPGSRTLIHMEYLKLHGNVFHG